MPIRHLFVFLLLLPLFWGCDKEPLSPDDAAPGSALIGERSGPSQAEIQEALAAIDSIKVFKQQVDRWRDGLELSKSMDAEQAAEQVETAINFYISKPGQAYEDYTTVVDSVSVPTSSSTWSGAQIAAFFNAMKGRLVHHFGQVSGTDKAYQFVDMGMPVADGSGSKVYFMANIGSGSVAEVPSAGSNLTDCECEDFGLVKWGPQAPLDPNANVSCTGLANEIIGVQANRKIGFVMRNLAPSVVNPTNNNNPLRADVRILSPFTTVQTNFLGASNPFGGPSPIITISIRLRTPEWAFPFLDNEVNECNQSPDYKTLGQYAVHVDTTFVTGAPGPSDGRFPDENCFCIQPKLFNYIERNVEAGEFYAPWVNLALFPNNPPSFFFRRRLVSTVVSANRQDPFFNESNFTVRLQEHPTTHLYAAFVLIPDVVIGPPIATPLEL